MANNNRPEVTIVTEKALLAEVFKEVVCEMFPEAKMFPRRLLTESETALLLGVKGQTLAVWRSNSVGPSYIKVGSTVRYRQQDIEEYLEQNRISR